jgi:hypothetical protein
VTRTVPFRSGRAIQTAAAANPLARGGNEAQELRPADAIAAQQALEDRIAKQLVEGRLGIVGTDAGIAKEHRGVEAAYHGSLQKLDRIEGPCFLLYYRRRVTRDVTPVTTTRERAAKPGSQPNGLAVDPSAELGFVGAGDSGYRIPA